MTALAVRLERTWPCPSLAHRVARPADIAKWNNVEHARRTCCYCHTKYREGGGAWVCEHWHEGT